MQKTRFTFSGLRTKCSLALLLSYIICLGDPLKAQEIGIYSDVFLGAGASLAFHGTDTHFFNGLVRTDPTQAGEVVFSGAARVHAVDHDSHVETPVRLHGQADFVFPVGDTGIYQPLAVRALSTPENALKVRFHQSPPPQAELLGEIEQLSPNFYWTVEGDQSGLLELSWNNFSQLDAWVEELSALRLVGYTGAAWEILPATLSPLSLNEAVVPSLNEGAITTNAAVDFSNYTAFSLGATTLDTALYVSQAITPNGDGINDLWYIENIERYPQAVIRVYNRWGAQVFYQAHPYTNDWGGTYNNNNKPLPSAPYLYRIDLDGDGEVDLEGWIYINH